MSKRRPYPLTDDEVLIVNAAVKVTVATVTGTPVPNDAYSAMMWLAQIASPAGSEKADYVWELYRNACDNELSAWNGNGGHSNRPPQRQPRVVYSIEVSLGAPLRVTV